MNQFVNMLDGSYGILGNRGTGDHANMDPGQTAQVFQLARPSHSPSIPRSSHSPSIPVSGLKSVFYRKIDFWDRKNDQEKNSEIFVHVAPEKTLLNQVSEKSCSKKSF